MSFVSGRAVLCGINNYPSSPLNGCVNDSLLMFKILTEKFKFNPKEIKLLTNEECSKKNIIEAHKWLITGANENKFIVFCYSGHGSQIVVDDITATDEVDGYDEIICPVDISFDQRVFIRDNELGSFYKRLPQSCHSLVILDSCCSGTGLRNSGVKKNLKGLEFKSRFLPPPPSNLVTNPTISIDDDLKFSPKESDSRDIRTQKRSFLVDTSEQGNTVLISGCRDYQESADFFNGRMYHGALTFYLAKLLRDSNWNISYEKLVNEVNKSLKSDGFSQEPQLEGHKGNFSSLFLGGSSN